MKDNRIKDEFIKVKAKTILFLKTRQRLIDIEVELPIEDFKNLIDGNLSFIPIQNIKIIEENDDNRKSLKQQFTSLKYLSTSQIYGISYNTQLADKMIQIFNLESIFHSLEVDKTIKEHINIESLKLRLNELYDEYEVLNELEKADNDNM